MKTYTFRVGFPKEKHMWRTVELRGDQTLNDLHRVIQRAYEFDNDHLYSFFMSGKAWDRMTQYSLPEDMTPWGIPIDDDFYLLDDADLIDLDEDEVEEEPEEYVPISDYDFAKEVYGQEIADLLALPPDEFQRFLEKRSAKTGEPIKFIQNMIQRMRDDIAESNRLSDVGLVTLESLGLTVRKEFMYLFDYGDEWRFMVRVEAINLDAPDTAYPRIVESMGQPPEQYPNWEDPPDSEQKLQERFAEILALPDTDQRVKRLIAKTPKGLEQLYKLHDYLAFALTLPFPANWREADKSNKVKIQDLFVDNLAQKVVLKAKPAKGKIVLIPAKQVWAEDEASQNAKALDDYRAWMSKPSKRTAVAE